MATKKLNSGTTKGQRAAIWAILVLTVVSTVGLYFSMFLGQKNESESARQQQENLEKYQAAYNEYTEKISALTDELSSKYYGTFSKYKSRAVAFNAADAEKAGIKTEDLVKGTGAEFKAEETEKYTAYYLGWKPDGTIFDGSISEETLKYPIVVEKSGDTWGMIEGWTEGLEGMKVGGVREITIPSEKAYGESGSANSEDTAKSINPNEPIKFVVMLVENFDEPDAPDYRDYGF